MLKLLFLTTSLTFASFLGSCQSTPIEKESNFISIEKLFIDATQYDGNLVCSSGFSKVGEGISVYPDLVGNIKNPYEIAVLLDFRNAQRPKPYNLKTNQKINFCGEVHLQKGCWKELNPKITGPSCVPFNKPIHLKVSKFSF